MIMHARRFAGHRSIVGMFVPKFVRIAIPGLTAKLSNPVTANASSHVADRITHVFISITATAMEIIPAHSELKSVWSNAFTPDAIGLAKSLASHV